MRHRFIILIFLCYSCVSNTNDSELANSNLEFDFQAKVFDFGETQYVTDSCKFFFPCDCCSGHLIFNPDSSFFITDYCMNSMALRPGKYRLADEKLLLDFGPLSIIRDYNYEREYDASAVEFFMWDTVFDPISITYDIEFCDQKIMLRDTVRNERAIETEDDYLERMTILKNYGFLEIIENKN